MLEENNARTVQAETGSGTSVATIPEIPDQHENRPKAAKRNRIARDPGNGTDMRSVRIGRMAVPESHPQQILPLSPTARSEPVGAARPETPPLIVPVAELAAIREAIADMQKSRSDDAALAKRFADLNEKFDSMKDSFKVLEAHVSVGLAKSIAEMMNKEAGALQDQIVKRYRYRTRYYLALLGAFALAAMIAVDRAYPFFDRVANTLGY